MMNSLAAEELLDSPLVFVLADNGHPFPHAKTRLHDSGMKTALITHWPARLQRPGVTCESLVSSNDITSTLLDATDAPAMPTAQGVSLMPTPADPITIVRHHAFSEHNRHDCEAHGRSVRSDGYLFIRNQRPKTAWQGPADSVALPSHQSLLVARTVVKLTAAQQEVFLSPRPVEELYLTANAPLQLHNLATDATHVAANQRLSRLLGHWIEETGDAAPDDLSPGGYDRETGKPLIKGPPKRGIWPGKPRAADLINAPGPH